MAPNSRGRADAAGILIVGKLSQRKNKTQKVPYKRSKALIMAQNWCPKVCKYQIFGSLGPTFTLSPGFKNENWANKKVYPRI